MELNKEELIEHGLQFITFLFVTLILLSEYLEREYILLTASVMFFFIGGLAEYIFMNQFYSKESRLIKPSDKLIKKIKDGFLWVHANIYFIKKYGKTIYDFKKIGVATSFISYLIMLAYLVIAKATYGILSDYSILIYLIPIITNSYFFLKNKYYILK